MVNYLGQQCVLIYRWTGRKKEAAEACRILAAQRPQSIRAENARDLLATDYKNF